MTEEESKTKWCPFARVWVADELGGTSINRFGDTAKTLHPNAFCIGSACMAFRWSYPPNEASGNKNGPQGFCGLASKP